VQRCKVSKCEVARGRQLLQHLLIPSTTSPCQMTSSYRRFKKDPVGTIEELRARKATFVAELKQLTSRGPTDQGLYSYMKEIGRAVEPVLDLQMAGIWIVLPVFRNIERIRREGKTEEEKQDADALLGGFVGDPLMEMNIDMYKLARKLPSSVWKEYNGRLADLAEHINQNVSGKLGDLPLDFVESWKEFIDKHGYDGIDQLFVSSPRHHEEPELLLAKLRQNISNVKDPEETAKEKLKRRLEVQEKMLNNAGCCSRGKIAKQNLIMDNVMWVRNAPKLVISQVYASLRSAVLVCAHRLMDAGRLDQAHDIFHLKISEVDQCLTDSSIDVRQLIAPRKKQYLRAKQAKSCPFLIDSRCRILKPNVVQSEPGTLVGAAISPGVVVEGVVRLMTSPYECLEPGEVIATVVTDPAWTPLFAGCSAVILQIGGALQHGALCAREYGKPAVSGIDVMGELKTGMRVSVDGNTGIVKILDAH